MHCCHAKKQLHEEHRKVAGKLSNICLKKKNWWGGTEPRGQLCNSKVMTAVCSTVPPKAGLGIPPPVWPCPLSRPDRNLRLHRGSDHHYTHTVTHVTSLFFICHIMILYTDVSISFWNRKSNWDVSNNITMSKEIYSHGGVDRETARLSDGRRRVHEGGVSRRLLRIGWGKPIRGGEKYFIIKGFELFPTHTSISHLDSIAS